MAKSKKYRDTLAMAGSDLYKLLDDGEDAKAEKSYFETEQASKKTMGEHAHRVWKENKKHYEFAARKASEHMAHVYARVNYLLTTPQS
jgi:hypothetical protein